MKKLSLNDFAKANVTLEKKGMKSVKGGDEQKGEIQIESWSFGVANKEIDVTSWSWG